MTHLEQITKQATEALNAYAAKAGVPADKIPALKISESDTIIVINTPGLRVAADIAKAIDVPGFEAKLNGATIYCTTAAMRKLSAERTAAHNAKVRSDVDEWLPEAMDKGWI